MQNNEIHRVEEDIRQYKLYKIQKVEQDIRKYQAIFDKIKMNSVVKFTKNSTSWFFIFILYCFAIIPMLLGVFAIYLSVSYFSVDPLSGNQNDIMMSGISFHLLRPKNEEQALSHLFIGVFYILSSIPFLAFASLLRKNTKKRNTISKLANLVKDVIQYMDENVKEDKKKYEYFVDAAAEVANKNRQGQIK